MSKTVPKMSDTNSDRNPDNQAVSLQQQWQRQPAINIGRIPGFNMVYREDGPNQRFVMANCHIPQVIMMITVFAALIAILLYIFINEKRVYFDYY